MILRKALGCDDGAQLRMSILGFGDLGSRTPSRKKWQNERNVYRLPKPLVE
jgi:hypothetical protein